MNIANAEEIIGWDFDLSSLNDLVRDVKSDVAKEPAKVFAKALAELDDLRMIAPHVAGEGVRLFYWTLGYIQTKGDQNEKIKGADRWLNEYIKREGTTKEVGQIIDHTLAEFARRPAFAAALNTVNFVSVPAIWTALECLARDLWTASLNSSSTSVMHRAFQAIDREDLGRRSVAISELAKYGFDIRHKVGTIVASKFSFSDFDGIQKAFRVLQPTARLAVDADARELFLLEKARHLIVHRAGYVDEKFKRETGFPGELDTRISLSAKKMGKWITAVVRVGINMIKTVDSSHSNRS